MPNIVIGGAHPRRSPRIPISGPFCALDVRAVSTPSLAAFTFVSAAIVFRSYGEDFVLSPVNLLKSFRKADARRLSHGYRCPSFVISSRLDLWRLVMWPLAPDFFISKRPPFWRCQQPFRQRRRFGSEDCGRPQ